MPAIGGQLGVNQPGTFELGARGEQSFSDACSGSITLSGTHVESRSASATVSGSVSVVGSVAEFSSESYTPAGSISLAGAASDARAGTDTRSGSFTLAGSAADARTGSIAPGGTITLSGALLRIFRDACTGSLVVQPASLTLGPETLLGPDTLLGPQRLIEHKTGTDHGSGQLQLSGAVIELWGINLGQVRLSGKATDSQAYAPSPTGAIGLQGECTATTIFGREGTTGRLQGGRAGGLAEGKAARTLSITSS